MDGVNTRNRTARAHHGVAAGSVCNCAALPAVVFAAVEPPLFAAIFAMGLIVGIAITVACRVDDSENGRDQP